MSNSFCCPCNCKEQGGIQISGKSWVLTGKAGDGHVAILPLQEQGSGIEDEYHDICNNLHGTGGAGDIEAVFERVNGVACQFAQLGTSGIQFIELPEDNIPSDQSFAVSCWINIQSEFVENPIFSRGESFIVSTSFLNHIMATVTDSTGVTYTAFSGIIEKGKWYHLAVSWQRYGALRIYLNGELSGETNSPIGEIMPVNGGDMIGSVSNGRGFVGLVQDIRIHPEERSTAWWQAEHQNYCGEFFEVLTE